MGQFTVDKLTPVLLVEKNGIVLYANVQEEPLLQDWDAKVGTSLPPEIRAIVERTLEYNIPEKIEVQGSKRKYLITFHPLPEEECVNIYKFEMLNDVELGFHTLAENTPDQVIRFDRQKNCLYANPAAMKFYGLSVDELTGKTYFKTQTNSEMMILTEKQCEKAFITGKPEATEFHYILPPGKVYYFDTKIIPEFLNAEISSFLVISRDITAIKESEATLRSSNLYNRSLIEASLDPLVIIGNDGNVTDVNKATEQATGYSRNDLVGTHFVQYLTEPDHAISAFRHVCTHGELRDCALEIKHRDGHTTPVLCNASVYRDENGKVIGVFVASRDITERKKAEKALKEAHETLEEKVKERTDELEKAYNLLKESEKGLAEAQKMAHIGNWLWDLITNEFYCSEELYSIFGLKPQEIDAPYKEVFKYIHPEDREYVTNSILEALNGKRYDAVDFRIILDDGTERALHTQGEVIFNEKSTPIRMKGTVQDITESKQMEEALRESELKYRNIIETTNEGILVINGEIRITFANKKLSEMLGYNLDEIIGRSLFDFLDEEGKSVTRSNMKKRRQGIDQVFEFRLVRKDGTSFWVLVSSKALLEKDGRFAGSMSMLTDITERKEAEEKIKRLANIVESSNDAIITISLEGIVTSWNKGAEQIYGFMAEEVLGKHITIIEPDSLKGEIIRLAGEIKQGKNVNHFETVRSKKDNTTINVSVTLSPITDQYGKVVAVSCIGGDITEKKIAEQFLQEKKIAEVANRTKSDFLAKISHELRTPLNSIIGFSDMLLEQIYGELNEKQIRATMNISKSGKLLLNLINNLLDISKVESGKTELNYRNFELVSKLNLIRNLMLPIADRDNIKIEIDIDDKLTSICADEDKFVQIMYNLVDNAMKFSFENSSVKIGARRKGDLVEITVMDTGIGIKGEDHYKLFKPFSQIDTLSHRKSQGTGLGLSLVKQIVHLHGGYVWFRSTPSKGSTFAFVIPIDKIKKTLHE